MSSPPRSALTRRRLLQSSAALAASTIIPGCGSSTIPATTTPVTPVSPNPQPTPNGPIVAANLTVIATNTGSIPPGFAGLSYEKYQLYDQSFSSSNAAMVALFNRLGTSVLRIGGGSTDTIVWAANGPGKTSGQVSPADINVLATFLNATGWKCLYAINLGGSGPGGTAHPTTPALAAAEVAYVVKTLGASLLGIEIGNEPDSYDTTYYAGTTWNVTVFEALWEQYRTAILATTPTAPLTGPAVAVFSRLSSWTVPFGQYVTKSQISLFTQHYYRATEQSPTATAANLILPDTTLTTGLQTLLTGAQSIGLPYRISECNNYSNGGAAGASNAYASALWAIDFMFNCVQGGAAGVNFHGGGDATASYTPITDNNGVVNGVRPEYYGIYLFSLAAQAQSSATGTLYQTTVNAGSLNVTAYAIKTPSGGINLLVNNKDSTNNLQITAQLPQTIENAPLIAMTQLTPPATTPSLSATGNVYIQGAQVNIDGSYSPAAAYIIEPSGNQLTFYVPALSAVLLTLS